MAQANDPQGGEDERDMPPLRLSRILHARRETVFEAWGSADHVRRWFSPETFSVPEAEIVMEVGGPFKLTMLSPRGEEHRISGRFVEVAPNARLAIDMEIEDGAGNKLFRAYTEVEFRDAPGGTRIDIVQTYTLIDPSKGWMVTGAPEGWRSTLDKLEREVARSEREAKAAIRSVVHAAFHLERSYDAPAARVWQALTEPSAKEKWFHGTPGSWELLERRMDVRIGGSERLKGRWESGTVSTFDAVYHDVVANERLVYSYAMHLDERKISVSLATIELKGSGGTTTLVLTEQGAFLDGYDDAGAREQGTLHLLDALGAALKD